MTPAFLGPFAHAVWNLNGSMRIVTRARPANPNPACSRPGITFVATDHSSQAGTISSTFRVRAGTVDDAQEIALRVFTAALVVARVNSKHGGVLVEVAGP
jgi:hypothetical protein